MKVELHFEENKIDLSASLLTDLKPDEVLQSGYTELKMDFGAINESIAQWLRTWYYDLKTNSDPMSGTLAVGDETYSFRNAFIQDVVYDEDFPVRIRIASIVFDII